MKNKTDPSAATGPYTPVARPAQIRALTSTLRQDIVDLVQAMAEASVPELAAALSKPADALYYHVRALRKAGLLVEAGVRRRGRHEETLYSTPDPSRPLKLEYRRGGETATRPIRTLVGAMLRNARKDFDRAIADPQCAVAGPRRELWAGRAKGWLTPAELERANALLTQLGELMRAPRTAQRNRLYSLQFVLAPSQDAPESADPPPPVRRKRKGGPST